MFPVATVKAYWGECGCCCIHFSPWHKMGGSVELYVLDTLAPVLIACEAWLTPQLVWMFCSGYKSFASTGF